MDSRLTDSLHILHYSPDRPLSPDGIGPTITATRVGSRLQTAALSPRPAGWYRTKPNFTAVPAEWNKNNDLAFSGGTGNPANASVSRTGARLPEPASFGHTNLRSSVSSTTRRQPERHLGGAYVGNLWIPKYPPKRNPTMTNLNESTILSGAGADQQATVLPALINGHSASAMDQRFGRSNLDDIEDFVPINLRDQEQPSDSRNCSSTAPRASLSSGYMGWTIGGTNITPSLPFSQQNGPAHQDQQSSETPSFSPKSYMSSYDAHGYETGSSDRMHIHTAVSSSHDPWDTMSRMKSLSINGDDTSPRTFSRLRPDVASYQPANATATIAPYRSQPYGTQRACLGEDRSPTGRNGGTFNPASNKYPPGMSSALFGVNGINGVSGDTMLANYGTSFQLQSSYAPVASDCQTGSSYDTMGHFRSAPNLNHDLPDAQSGISQWDFQHSHPETTMDDGRIVHMHLNPTSTDPRAVVFPDSRFADQAPNLYTYPTPIDYEQQYYRNLPKGSPAMEDFRMNMRHRKFELADLWNHIVEFSGDPHGSRLVQERMETASREEKDRIFSELQVNARQLMNDAFGNYVIQKMFDYATQAQKRVLAGYMKGHVFNLSTHTFGCRCVQKAFDHVLIDQQAELVRELDGHVIKAVESQHGNHVIQKAIESIPSEHIRFIVDAHKGQAVRLARHSYGCRVVQRLLENCAPHTTRIILDELHSALPILINDPYGNYVVQCMILKCGADDRYRVIEVVRQDLHHYSTHKFASNVVEKAINNAGEEQCTDILQQLTAPNPNNYNQTPVLNLIKDQYGNYVMQTVLRKMQGPGKIALVNELRDHLNNLSRVSNSKQVVAMSKTLEEVTAGNSPSSTSTGPRTPHTPTSLESGGGNPEPPKMPYNSNVPSLYSGRTRQRYALPIRPAN